MAESAVSLVLDYLVQEARLLGGIHDEVASIRAELEMIQSFIKDADARADKEGVSNVARTWVRQAREKTFHIEDVIDEYILHITKHPQKRKRFRFLVDIIPGMTLERHVIASKIQNINNDLKALRERGESFGFNSLEQGGPSYDTRCDPWHDPRMASLFIEENELVGIESPKNELIELLVKGQSNRTVISVVGIGGLGKTTLVKKVYDNEQVASHFDCNAWITVSQSYKMEEILRNMIKDFYEARKEFPPRKIDTMEETQLINELRQYLLEQRYVVVFDDIWNISFWGHIKLALPDNKKGSRIVITTRSEIVAPSNIESPSYHVYKLSPLPLEEAQELFCKKVFQREGGHCPPELVEFANGIIKRCGGLPLAIVTIGGLLSTKKKTASEWCKFLDSLSSELESNPHLLDITKILSFSYQDQPYNLKACFLYFGMFPEDYVINCARLIRLWIAEGFVKEKQGLTLEDVAQDYLSHLIYTSLVQVAKVDFVGKTRSCRVHDMMREVTLSRSEELSFCHVSITNNSIFDGIRRRLSIQNNVNPHSESITSSQTRSILILGVDEVPDSFLTTCFAHFNLMKTMDFEGAPIDYIPEEVGNLFHLRYLSLRDTKVEKLPKSIGKLKNLETLDLKRSRVSELPVEISGLSKLRYLVAYFENNDIKYNIHFRRAVKIHSGIRCLQSLEKLFNIEANNDAVIAELGSLGQLRKLAICKLKRENGITFCTTLKKMSHLRSLLISATSEEEFLGLQLMSTPLPLLQSLCLRGRLEKLPEWIPQLKSIVRIHLSWSRLMDDPFKVLQALPNLMYVLLHDGYEGEQLHIEGGGFLKLKYLVFRNLRGLKRLIIEEGSLPLLEKLEIGSCPLLKEVPFGIHHLKSLKQLEFRDMPREFVLSLQPNEGLHFSKVKHIPTVEFWYRTKGENYKGYKIGDPELLEHLQS
uniref:Disease resistance protein RPM1-like n=1 Tax=Fagus sylvatica TaxID=28930 RepID=A0A2N9HYF5_FAGSY